MFNTYRRGAKIGLGGVLGAGVAVGAMYLTGIGPDCMKEEGGLVNCVPGNDPGEVYFGNGEVAFEEFTGQISSDCQPTVTMGIKRPAVMDWEDPSVMDAIGTDRTMFYNENGQGEALVEYNPCYGVNSLDDNTKISLPTVAGQEVGYRAPNGEPKSIVQYSFDVPDSGPNAGQLTWQVDLRLEPAFPRLVASTNNNNLYRTSNNFFNSKPVSQTAESTFRTMNEASLLARAVAEACPYEAITKSGRMTQEELQENIAASSVGRVVEQFPDAPNIGRQVMEAYEAGPEGGRYVINIEPTEAGQAERRKAADELETVFAGMKRTFPDAQGRTEKMKPPRFGQFQAVDCAGKG